MNKMVCVAEEATMQEAAAMVQLFTANEVVCVARRISSNVPDLGSNGIRQILVEREDLDKARRLIAEMEPYPEAAHEYHAEGVLTRRQDFIARLGHWFSGRDRS